MNQEKVDQEAKQNPENGHSNEELQQKESESSSETFSEDQSPEDPQLEGSGSSESQNQSKETQTEVEEEDFRSKFYYMAAELENTKKRFEREKQNLIKFGNEHLLSQFLEVLDNFERVIMAVENETDEKMKNMKVGMTMVKDQFLMILAQNGVKPIEGHGQSFDPNIHEAMSEEVDEEKDPGTVLRELVRGYMLKERVLRAAKVVVSKRAED